jgi:hypothetical protein
MIINLVEKIFCEEIAVGKLLQDFKIGEKKLERLLNAALRPLPHINPYSLSVPSAKGTSSDGKHRQSRPL